MTASPDKEPYQIILRATGGPEAFETEAFTPRAPGPGEVRVRQTAVGLNFIDTYHRTGLYPVPLPAVLGSEGAGIVEAVGDGVDTLQPGDRVAYLGRGTYATHFTGPASIMVKLPDGVSEAIGAAALLKGLTAWMLLHEIRPMTAGESVLVWAPAGGVGSFLVPWATSLGLDVFAVTSTAEKAARVRDLGASHVVIGYEDVASAVKAANGGKGVHVAFDSVGKTSQAASLAALRPRGWYMTYGNASGPADPVSPSQLAAGGSLTMIRPGLFDFIRDPAVLKRGAATLFGAMRAGTVQAHIGQRFALSKVADAHVALESGKTQGSTLLVP
ncbi:MAG: quinone oxidoreductase [Pseudomonadota bacterium]